MAEYLGIKNSKTWKKGKNSEELWLWDKTIFPNIKCLMCMPVTLTVPIAEIERSFSLKKKLSQKLHGEWAADGIDTYAKSLYSTYYWRKSSWFNDKNW